MKVTGICKIHGETDFLESEYYSSSRGKMKKWKVCCQCRKESKHKSYLKHRATILEKNRTWRENNKEHKAEKDREYYLNNKAKIHKYSCQYQKQNGYKQSKRWKRENKDKVVEYRTRRKAMQYGAEINDFTNKQWKELLTEHNNTCFYCGSDNKKLTQDHVVPLYRGGNHTKDNIVPACMSCNCSKGIKLLNEWRPLENNN